MTPSSRAMLPWDTIDYQRIVSASYTQGEVVVAFADGAEARLSPHCLVSAVGPAPDWPNLRAEDFHLVVPSQAGELEIPWDVIRVHSDAAYDAFWAELTDETAGSRVERRVESAD